MPLLVGRAASLAALEAANERGSSSSCSSRSATPETQEPAAADLYRVGVVARIRQLSRSARARCACSSRASRARASRATCRAPTACAPSSSRCRAPGSARTDEVLLRRTLSLFEEYVALHRRLPAELVDADPERGLAGAAGVRHRGAPRHAARSTPGDCSRSTSCPPCSARSATRSPARSSCCGSSARSTTTCAARCSRTSASSTCRSSSRRSTASSAARTETTATTSPRQLEAKGLPERGRARARCASCAGCAELASISPEAGVARTYLDWIAALPWTRAHRRRAGRRARAAACSTRTTTGSRR